MGEGGPRGETSICTPAALLLHKYRCFLWLAACASSHVSTHVQHMPTPDTCHCWVCPGWCCRDGRIGASCWSLGELTVQQQQQRTAVAAAMAALSASAAAGVAAAVQDCRVAAVVVLGHVGSDCGRSSASLCQSTCMASGRIVAGWVSPRGLRPLHGSIPSEILPGVPGAAAMMMSW
jgi:hypothetical protein